MQLQTTCKSSKLCPLNTLSGEEYVFGFSRLQKLKTIKAAAAAVELKGREREEAGKQEEEGRD